MYLYKKDCPGLRKGHKKTKKTIRVGIKQHTRAFQPIPDELRRRVAKPSVSLAMWELKRRKQEKEEEPPAFEWFDGKVRPGRFWTQNVVAKQVDLLREGYAPAVGLNNLFEKSNLMMNRGNHPIGFQYYMNMIKSILKFILVVVECKN